MVTQRTESGAVSRYSSGNSATLGLTAMMCQTLRASLLTDHRPFEVIPHHPTTTLLEAAEDTGIPLSQLARAVILADPHGLVMAILPADHLLNFQALRELLGRRLRPATLQEIGTRFADCEPGSIPPLAAPYGLEAVVDERLSDLDRVYIEPGQHDALVCLQGVDFQQLHATSCWARFARPVAALAQHREFDFVLPQGIAVEQIQALCPAEDIRRQIQRMEQLPAMPEMAHELLILRNRDSATIRDLGNILDRDPSLTAQIIGYAHSSYFGYRGPLDTIEQAIARVLGFDTAINMALGIAAGKSFQTPRDGPLGLYAFWRHAIYSAALCQALAALLPRTLGIRRGTAYLAGLLHNLGFLLLGHRFKPEFFLLNKTVELNPDIPVTLIEKRLLGIDHCEMGAVLLASWGLPEEIIIAAQAHHNEQYSGRHAHYAHLVLLADQLLRSYDMGDGALEDPPTGILNTLGLSLDDVLRLTQHVVEDVERLNGMAQQLTG